MPEHRVYVLSVFGTRPGEGKPRERYWAACWTCDWTSGMGDATYASVQATAHTANSDAPATEKQG